MTAQATFPSDAGATATDNLPVVVIGAGPVGLAAAAHLLERGLQPLVLEAGNQAGAAVEEWGHIRLFSPWTYNIDAAARRLLEQTGWVAPKPAGLPTGAELLSEYLRPLAATEQLAPRIRTGQRVVAVTRAGLDKTHTRGRDSHPFLVRTRAAGGEVVDHLARAVVDASGTWGQRNPLGASGLPAVGEDAAAACLAGPLPDVLGRDRARFAGRHSLVVGAGHSATNTLLSLVRLAEEEPGTRITWVVRGTSVTRTYGGGDADGLPARGALGSALRDAVAAGHITLHTGVSIRALEPEGSGVTVVADGAAGPQRLSVDVVAAATGFRPDLDLLRELRLELDPGVEAPRQLAPLIDPEHHSCGTVPPHGATVLSHPEEPGFYLAGMKSYGRAPTFLLATGYEQVRSIAAALAGDPAAAAEVHLDLPETGVCSSAPPTTGADGRPEIALAQTSSSCCGSSAEPEPVSTSAEPDPVSTSADLEPVSMFTNAGAGTARGFATGFSHGRTGTLTP